MAISIAPDSNTPKQPNKRVFDLSGKKEQENRETRKGVFLGNVPGGDAKGLKTIASSVSKQWYSGDSELPSLLDAYMKHVTGERSYGAAGAGARFGFLGHVARRLPKPVLFDAEELVPLLGNTACVDSAGRMWMYAPFFKECVEEENKGNTMVLPLINHEHSHVALEHVHRMHSFDPDISNWAKDAVINPMVKKLYPEGTQFSKIFSEAWGNRKEDERFKDLAEETIAKIMQDERDTASANKGVIHIKKLILQDGPASKVTTLSAGKGERKEFDTVVVNVQDMGMFDKMDHQFDCATLEVDDFDNRLKPKHANGGPGQQQPQSGIEGRKIISNKPQKGQGDSSGSAQSSQDAQDADAGGNDPSRKSLDQILKDMKGQGSQADQGADQDPAGKNGGSGQGKDKEADGQQPQDGNASGQGNEQDPSGNPSPANGGGDPNKQNGSQQAQGNNPQGKGRGREDNSPDYSGDPGSLFDGTIRQNPMNSAKGHEIDVGKLASALKEMGYGDLLGTIRIEDHDPKMLDRVIEESLMEATQEKLRIGSGYAGSHIDDYVKTVVKPSLIYQISWERRVMEFLQGQGTNVARSMDEFGTYTYVDPVDMGMAEGDTLYYAGNILQKPDERFAVVIDTSGSVWTDKKRLSHFLSFAVGIRAGSDDLAPDVDIYSADTVVTGKPVPVDDDTIYDAIAQGVPLGGGGGTDFSKPINQLMAYAKDNEIEYQGVIYVTDLECSAPAREDLPENLPPLLWVAMPHDYARAERFIRAVREYSEVVVMDKNMHIDLGSAQEKAEASAESGRKIAP